MSDDVQLVLVTGSPRSGTTAVGQMLALGRGVGTLHEPFNRLVGLKEIEHVAVDVAFIEEPATTAAAPPPSAPGGRD